VKKMKNVRGIFFDSHCTSDHEHSTRMGEACTSCKPKPRLGTRTRTGINVNVA